MQHPEFPIVSFLSLPFVLLPLPSYIRSCSISVISLAAWLAVISIIRGVDTIAWAGNVDIKLQVWCDITTKINLGFTVAVPLSALCLMQRLESIASVRRSTIKPNDRRRQISEVIVCFGVPMIFMALSYVVQGHRFDLAEDFGCIPAVYFSVAAMFILWIPPLFFSLVSFVFSALTLRHFLRHRISFATHLSNSHSNLSTSHYFRLMALAITDMFWSTGVNVYILWYNITGGFRPWISWDNVHSNFSRIGLFPTLLLPEVAFNQMIVQFWIPPISCVLFFLLLGLGREAMADYRAALIWFRRVVLRRPVKVYQGSRMVLPFSRPKASKQDEVSPSASSILIKSPNQAQVYSLPLPVSTTPGDALITPSVSSRANSSVSVPFRFGRLSASSKFEEPRNEGDGQSMPVIDDTTAQRLSFPSDHTRDRRCLSNSEIDVIELDTPFSLPRAIFPRD